MKITFVIKSNLSLFEANTAYPCIPNEIIEHIFSKFVQNFKPVLVIKAVKMYFTTIH